LLGLLTLLVMLIVFLRAVKAAQKPATADAAMLEAGAAGDAARLEAGEAGAASALGAGEPEPDQLPPPTAAELEERRVRAIELASKDPLGAAIILTRWLSSGDQTASPPGGAT
jgi:hypothetical protein